MWNLYTMVISTRQILIYLEILFDIPLSIIRWYISLLKPIKNIKKYIVPKFWYTVHIYVCIYIQKLYRIFNINNLSIQGKSIIMLHSLKAVFLRQNRPIELLFILQGVKVKTYFKFCYILYVFVNLYFLLWNLRIW